MDEGVQLPPLSQAQIDKIVRKAFHDAWGVAHDAPGYDKNSWRNVQPFLDPAYRNQLPKPPIKPDADGTLKLAGGNITIKLPPSDL